MNGSEIVKKIEHYKFLFKDHFQGTFDLLNFIVSDVSFYKNKVENFYLEIKFDYLKSGGGSAREWGKLLKDIENELVNFFEEYSFSQNKNKIVYNLEPKEFYLKGVFFTEINFLWDEKHEVEISCLFETTTAI